jgi:hypothetical protein
MKLAGANFGFSGTEVEGASFANQGRCRRVGSRRAGDNQTAEEKNQERSRRAHLHLRFSASPVIFYGKPSFGTY